MKKTLAWMAVPALMLSLSACDSEPGTVTRGDDATASASSEAPASSESAEAASSEGAEEAEQSAEAAAEESETTETEAAATEATESEEAERSAESAAEESETTETEAAATESDETAATEATESEEASDKASEEAAAEAPIASGQPTFGDTYTWHNGLAVTVGQPQPFTPSEWASIENEDGQHHMFDVSVVNGTSEAHDAFEISLQASSGGEQSGMIFDTDNRIDVPTVSIQPGKTLNFKVAFTLKDPSDINMDVSPGWDYESVNFATQ
ncbi:hypothetical protein M3C74_07085 [Micrococcus lylae]|uniref:hypothetical protein n=1 Tax=Micrococcus TaxID=1269 RepID=UPI0008A3FB98|nr:MULTISPECIES: hypothetical protein [Micrococcus]MCT2007864.1 hypothetical protein [Micrococcus lylae]MCT2071595.1 hypothetical protein [Micrococcus lylae]OFR88738.1 hypothetical protein HMPREF2863_10520 [Micrococcus sp. HMSC067E09]WIK81446.1 hypothetical protein CJ228_007465 [Micrococcus lylae]